MSLFAISDLHLIHAQNREALFTLQAHPDDWLAIVGDVGETEVQLHFAFDVLGARFMKMIWVPGNHELWTDRSQLKGMEKYHTCIELARSYQVLTPEDPYTLMEFDGQPYYICPLFTLYDYTFCPMRLTPNEALMWAEETGIRCLDETRLCAAPYNSIVDWCHTRCDMTERRDVNQRMRQVLPAIDLKAGMRFLLTGNTAVPLSPLSLRVVG